MYLPLNAVLPPPRRRDAIVHMPPRASSTRKDGSRDFDFELGTWAVRGSRLLEPLSGSTEWLDFSRVSRATRIFNRGAVLVELESDTPTGLGDELLLRLYQPDSHQWSIAVANGARGGLGQPQIGEFRNGRGEFYGQTVVDGRTVYARSVIVDITSTSFTVEQALSDDGGGTWEVNCIARHTRVSR